MAGSVLRVLYLAICIFIIVPDLLADEKKINLDNLSLEKVMSMKVDSSSTLTKSNSRERPAAVTVITQEMIRSSQARSLFELLDIYVPHVQWNKHHWEADHLGVRGIINDRDDKYLLLVNGRNMNEKTHFGAHAERDTPLLADIHKIEVIRGPASSIYGPGAISMVINIITDTPATFEGTELIVRAGAIHEFGSVEYKEGISLGNDTGFLFYIGIADKNGAGDKYSKEVVGFDGTSHFGTYQIAGDPVKYNVSDNGAGFRNMPDIKMHLGFQHKNWESWFRFNRGGSTTTHAYQLLYPPPNGWNNAADFHAGFGYGSSGKGVRYPGTAYQHTSWVNKYTQEISKFLSVVYTLSLDSQEYARDRFSSTYSHREDEIWGQVLLNWDPVADHSLAFGVEAAYEEFGRKAHGFKSQTLPGTRDLDPWGITTYSALFEHQWRMSSKWTMFLGGRLDKHQYTHVGLSPRASLIYKATDKDTIKFLIARSLRNNNEVEMRRTQFNKGGKSDHEKIITYEIRWEREQNSQLSYAMSVFYHDMELLAFDDNAFASAVLADQSIYGSEIEALYKTDKMEIRFSHGYSKLDNFNLKNGITYSFSSVSDNGYGNDLANWSNHISKINVRYDFNAKLAMTGSLRYYWGFPGSKDAAEYDLDNPPSAYDGKHGRGFEENVYLNLGLEYKYDKSTKIYLHGYNLLGIFDRNLNKQNYYGSYGDYRTLAPSVGITFVKKF